MSLKRNFYIVLTICLLIAAVFIIPKRPVLVNSTQNASPSAVQSQISVEESIDYGGLKNPETQTLKVTGNETVLDLIKRTKNVGTKTSSYGSYVESIESVTGGTDGKYWLYYINGTQAQVGADKYVPKDGDKISWRFEKSG